MEAAATTPAGVCDVDVQAFLARLGLAEYAPIFGRERVTLTALRHLSFHDLHQRLHLPVGPARLVLAEAQAARVPAPKRDHAAPAVSSEPVAKRARTVADALRHCAHCDGAKAACTCTSGCAMPVRCGVVVTSMCYRHCEHCRGMAGRCGCQHECALPAGAACYFHCGSCAGAAGACACPLCPRPATARCTADTVPNRSRMIAAMLAEMLSSRRTEGTHSLDASAGPLVVPAAEPTLPKTTQISICLDVGPSAFRHPETKQMMRKTLEFVCDGLRPTDHIDVDFLVETRDQTKLVTAYDGLAQDATLPQLLASLDAHMTQEPHFEESEDVREAWYSSVKYALAGAHGRHVKELARHTTTEKLVTTFLLVSAKHFTPAAGDSPAGAAWRYLTTATETKCAQTDNFRCHFATPEPCDLDKTVVRQLGRLGGHRVLTVNLRKLVARRPIEYLAHNASIGAMVAIMDH
jgi:hypothetical protein